MADIAASVQTLKNAIAEFEAQYTKYTAENVNSAGSRSRKALMVAKKQINGLRKVILDDQKAKRGERKAAKAKAKAEATAAGTPAKTGKVGKKGKTEETAAAE
jgi:hypothetical protein